MILFGPNIKKMLEKRDIAGLAKALHHRNCYVSNHALEALGQIGDEQALQALIAAIEYNPSLRCQPAGYEPAKHVLVKAGGAAVDPLISMLSSPSIDMRCFCIAVLGQIRDARAVDPLVAQLNLNLMASYLTNQWKAAIARSLGQIGDKKAVGPLVNMLLERSRSVRESAAFALAEIGDPLGKALQAHQTYYLYEMITAMSAIKDPRTVRPLLNYLASERDRDLLAFTIKTLLELRHPSTIRPLMLALNWFGIDAVNVRGANQLDPSNNYDIEEGEEIWTKLQTIARERLGGWPKHAKLQAMEQYWPDISPPQRDT